MRLCAYLLFLLLALQAAPAYPATAGEDWVSGAIGKEGVDLGGRRDGGGGASPVADSRSEPNLVTIARFVPACAGNTYRTDPPTDVLCDVEALRCGTAEAEGRRFIRFVATVLSAEAVPPPGSAWTPSGIICRTPEEVMEAIISFTLADFRRLPLPPGDATVQTAANDEVLIRARTNVYVDAPEQTYNITILDTAVTVRATPVEYSWDFGDGTDPLVTTDPGAPYPDLTTWHTYETSGDHAITLTTSYAGEFSVAGGPFQAIPGTAEITGEPMPVTVVTTSNRLVG